LACHYGDACYAVCASTAPVPPPQCDRAQVKAFAALHLDALTRVTRLHLRALCRQTALLEDNRSTLFTPRQV
jgi:hypothetical protein